MVLGRDWIKSLNSESKEEALSGLNKEGNKASLSRRTGERPDWLSAPMFSDDRDGGGGGDDNDDDDAVVNVDRSGRW